MQTRSRDEWIIFLQKIQKGHLHVGPLASNYDSSFTLVQSLVDEGVLHDGDRILDIGCGNGRLAIALSQMNVHYVGIDIIPESIAFCRDAFRDTPFQFFCLDVRNAFYNPQGSTAPHAVVLPLESASFDTVIAESLFTHLGTLSACRQYVQEVWRVLRPGGNFYSTWFRSPPNLLHDGEDRTVLPEEDIRLLMESFVIRSMRDGATTAFHDQWRIFAQKPEIRDHVVG